MKCALIACGMLLPAVAAAQPEDRVPAYLLQVPVSVASLFIADTSHASFIRMDNGPDGIRYASDGYMSIGQNGVGKERAWDRRTPLGIYFVNDMLEASSLDERYGPVAFPLDYPNPLDRMHLRSGNGIWIHGVPVTGGRRPPRDTDGCIALPNDELLSLEKLMVPTATPVIITRELRWSSREALQAMRDQLQNSLDNWTSSLKQQDLYRYLQLYADDFTYRGMSRDEWASYRVAAITAMPIEDVVIDDILLLADPEDENLYLSRFRLHIVAGQHSVSVSKRLYWRRTDQGLKIVAEDNG